jgi:hypothetical protein
VLALALALAVSISPSRPSAGSASDPRLEGCFVHEKSTSSAYSDLSGHTTLCLFGDGSATQETLVTFMAFSGGGSQDHERREGTWSVRRGVLAFEDGEGRLAWRLQVCDDGLRLDGKWFRRRPLPEPEEEAQPDAEATDDDAGSDEEADEAEAARLREVLERLRVLVEAYRREQAALE